MHNTFITEYFQHWKPPTPSAPVRAVNQLLARLGKSVRLMHKSPDVMGSVESRMNIFHLANQVLEYGVPGDFAEVGCHAGYSSTVLQRVLLNHGREGALHVFDSFQGLPAQLKAEDQGAYEPGEMGASLDLFKQNFATAGLPLPHIHPGWFSDTLPTGLPERIAFALIDADIYESTLTALEHVYPRLSPGAVCMFGVYWDPAVYEPPTDSLKYKSPGVKKACDAFFADKPESVSVLYCGDYSAGYFRKRK